MTAPSSKSPRTEFLEKAVWHGTLEHANALLAAHPELDSGDIYTAAVLGNAPAVRRFLHQDPGNATAKGGPYEAQPLVYLCLSKYLRLDPSRSDGFVQSATALLDAGADPNAGFWNKGEFETAMYGAAGVAHHAGLTRVLLERGADPNDGEVVYHSPEEYDSTAMQLVVETGRVTPENLCLMLVRKIDWHDESGVRWLLEHGVAANFKRSRGWSPLHHALARDNSLAIITLLLDHGADPTVIEDGMTAFARAARGGRSDVLELFTQRGITIELQGVDRLIAACARGDTAAAHRITGEEPTLVEGLRTMGGSLLAQFTGTGNPPGVQLLLDLGVPPDSPFEGDGYFGIAKYSTALHVAAWRICPPVVKLLLQRGAEVNRRDGRGRTPLELAVRANVETYWTEWRTPESVRLLLEAGASLDGVPFPSGYAEVDQLLATHRL